MTPYCWTHPYAFVQPHTVCRAETNREVGCGLRVVRLRP